MQSTSEVGRVMTHNLCKPNWASGGTGEIRRPGPTGFDEEVRRLGLDEHTCAASRELRRWCERNKDRCYIPEWLVKEWGNFRDAELRPLTLKKRRTEKDTAGIQA